MGELRDKLFLQFVNQSLDKLRAEFREQSTPKKGNRFLIKGITYEIGPCRLDSGLFVFEISSKIPRESIPRGKSIEKYFKSVVRLVGKANKKPSSAKMENIVHNTQEEEIKERDYVKLEYRYSEPELYSVKDIEKRVRSYQANKTPLPDIPGVATPSGKIVLSLVGESVMKNARGNVQDLIDSNEEVKKAFKKEGAGGKEAAPAAKPAAKPRKTAQKPAVKKKKTGASAASKKKARR